MVYTWIFVAFNGQKYARELCKKYCVVDVADPTFYPKGFNVEQVFLWVNARYMIYRKLTKVHVFCILLDPSESHRKQFFLPAGLIA